MRISDWSSDVCSSDLQRVFEWQLRAGCEQPRLVEQVAVAQVDDAVPGGMRLGEDRRRAGFASVAHRETRAAIGAVIAGNEFDVADARPRVMAPGRRLDPRRRAVFPAAR